MLVGAFDSITADTATRDVAARETVGAIYGSLEEGAAWVCFSTFNPGEKDMRVRIENGAPWASVDCEAFGAAPFELPAQDCSYVYVCRKAAGLATGLVGPLDRCALGSSPAGASGPCGEFEWRVAGAAALSGRGTYI